MALNQGLLNAAGSFMGQLFGSAVGAVANRAINGGGNAGGNAGGGGGGGGQGNSVFSTGGKTFTHAASVGQSCIQFTLTNDGAKGTNLFEGLVAQQIQAQCGRQPQIIYELGTENYYAIGTKPSGSGTLQNVFGPTDAGIKGLKQLGDICHATTLTVNMKDCKCGSNGTQTAQTPLKFTGGFLTGVTISANAQSFLVNGSWSFTFQDLQEG